MHNRPAKFAKQGLEDFSLVPRIEMTERKNIARMSFRAVTRNLIKEVLTLMHSRSEKFAEVKMKKKIPYERTNV